ncbi:BTB domain-containing protein [Favolaschia claudopus]|uniref:BTB domain-containing protein n=1 Tax=Favolaschia claudopus TaxID=2862362 RepID=A0AAW0BFC0_9AGAR
MSTDNSEPPQRADRLWFTPDVVIIRAQSPVFQVFTAILKQKSSVFADMFTMPQPPPADSETMDGVPVVTVHDEPAQMEVFLRATFDSEFFMPSPAETKIGDTLGILRLAHKYDVPYLRRRALHHLEPMYPTDLSGYDSQVQPAIERKVPFAEHFRDRVLSVMIATEVGALWLLPATYYDICTWPLERILGEPLWKALREEEQHACLIGYQALLRQCPLILKFLLEYSSDQDTDCTDCMNCNQLRSMVYSNLSSGLSQFMNWPLDLWPKQAWAAVGVSLCAHCLSSAKELHAEARQNCWDALPGMFGLPDWDKLKEMRQEALGT